MEAGSHHSNKGAFRADSFIPTHHVFAFILKVLYSDKKLK